MKCENVPTSEFCRHSIKGDDGYSLLYIVVWAWGFLVVFLITPQTATTYRSPDLEPCMRPDFSTSCKSVSKSYSACRTKNRNYAFPSICPTGNRSVYVSRPVLPSIAVSISLHLCPFVALPISSSLCGFLLSSLILSVSFSQYLIFSVSVSFGMSVYLYLSVWLSLSVCLTLFVCLSVSLPACL